MVSLTVRMLNVIARPWETRFEPIVSNIKEHVNHIRWLADVGHIVISTETQQSARKLEHG